MLINERALHYENINQNHYTHYLYFLLPICYLSTFLSIIIYQSVYLSLSG